MDWDAIMPELDKKLEPQNIKKPDGKFGPKGDYIEGWHAIAEANEIFGYGGWSHQIDLRENSLVCGKDSKGNPQWQAAYTCISTVTVGDVVRQDVGFGSGFAKTVGDAIEGATKEAATDGLKRALRTFGNRFGLALYDKTRENVGSNLPPFDASAATARIKAAIEKAQTTEDLAAIKSGESETLNLVSDAQFDEIKSAFLAQQTNLTQKAA